MIVYIFILFFINNLFCINKGININSQKLEFFNEYNILNSSFSIFEINNKEYFIISDNDKDEIYCYNYPDMEIINKITPNFEIGGFTMIDSNLILLKEFETFNFYLFDINTNKLVREFYTNNIKNYNGYVNYNFFLNPIQYDGESIFFNAVINISPPQFFDYNCLGKINLSDSSIKIFGEFPEKMKDGNVWLDFYPNFCRKDDELLISFNPDSMIYIYDLDGNFKYSKEIKSKYVNEILPPDQKKSLNPNFSMQYQIMSPLYHNILYDKYRKVFYRVVTQSNDFYNIDGTVTDFFSQPFSIIIFDEEFNILDEIYFQNGIYDFTKILVTKDGLLVGHNVEGNSLKFNLITIKR